ncbi:pentapeptide repeat-containing protein [Methanoplanus sp. FWC-SCC4]|uniref:Pentapeptide repeat-containing protein n=1 Tax=Methanochimaera problematica TaxID=2609417 RepID=A0AA97FBP1_9EURY|nr:pentapeptide repeat-containing protein [Methanoplanus sp. FWC-SCC4]WOF16460.1 pentapeptide repeat-containing protein [Methanoplanus sp. FWC-SCC4]
MEEKSLLKFLIIALVLLTASVSVNILLYTNQGGDAENGQNNQVEPSEKTVKTLPESISYLDYTNAYLQGADLAKINAYKTIFINANLREADLHGAKLTLADLTGANLKNADLIGAKLDYAILVNADLEDADLSYADLRGADLTGADLRGAIIEGADLRWIKGEYLR